MRVTIDSSIWIEVIRGGARAQELAHAIETADQCFTPAIVMAEVAHWCLRGGLGKEASRDELMAMGESSWVVPLDARLALDGAEATVELRKSARARKLGLPGIADGLVLATSRATGSRLMTADAHFRGLPETWWLGSPVSASP